VSSKACTCEATDAAKHWRESCWRAPKRSLANKGAIACKLRVANVREDAHRFYAANDYVSSHQGFKKIL